MKKNVHEACTKIKTLEVHEEQNGGKIGQDWYRGTQCTQGPPPRTTSKDGHAAQVHRSAARRIVKSGERKESMGVFVPGRVEGKERRCEEVSELAL